MKTLIDWVRRLLSRETEWNDEIDTHLALREEWNQAHGLSPDAARTQARKQFGRPLATLEEIRSVHIAAWFDNLRQDTRQAARGFRRSPVFTAVAIATIAIGVGASTAVFSVIDPLLFRPLPYPQDEQLVSVGYFGPVDNNEFNVVSSYLDWRRYQTAFQSITSMRAGGQCDALGGDTPRQVTCDAVEASFLHTFGIVPAAGRDFLPEEDRPGAPPVALLGWQLWQSHFGGSADIVGRTITIDGGLVRVIGVLPKSFEMPQLGPVDVMLAERLNPNLARDANSSSFLRTFARLRPGVSIEEAIARMRPLYEDSLRQDVPAELRSEVRLVVRSLRDRQIHEVKLASWMLLGAVLALLLIACANVANLLLARAAARRRELAMRAAIGAGRARLIRQMLTESLLLGMCGGAAGSGAGWLLLRIFVSLAPNGMTRLEQARIDFRVLLFTLAVSVGAALLFGLAPALERPRAEALVGWHSAGPLRTVFRRVLVAGQVAISLVLLTGASLFLRSLWKLENQPLGFQPNHLVTASFTFGRQSNRQGAALVTFFKEVETRLKRIPGAGSFALSDSLPPRGSQGRPYSNMRIAGHPNVAPNGGMVAFRWVTPGYFQTMGIPILAGRDFQEAERASGETPVILNATLARRMFGAESPVGQQIQLDGNGRWEPIVGVAEDAKNNGIAGPAEPEYYRLRMNLPGQGGTGGGVALFRTSLDTAVLTRWIRREFAEIDPSLPVSVRTMDERVRTFTDQPRFVTMLVAVFAAFGLLLAAVGLYGVLSFLVAQQTREIGVRMAIGARPRDIALQVQRQAAVWTGFGLLAGLAGSLALTRYAGSLLFEVSPRDPVSLAISAATLLLIGVLAAWAPCYRASRVDPAIALRHE